MDQELKDLQKDQKKSKSNIQKLKSVKQMKPKDYDNEWEIQKKENIISKNPNYAKKQIRDMVSNKFNHDRLLDNADLQSSEEGADP